MLKEMQLTQLLLYISEFKNSKMLPRIHSSKDSKIMCNVMKQKSLGNGFQNLFEMECKLSLLSYTRAR